MQKFVQKATVGMAAVLMPTIHAFKALDKEEIQELTQDPEMQRLSLINEIGTAPCVFKVDNSFYDFTPIKLAHPNPQLGFWDGTINGSTIGQVSGTDPTYEFVWGWCQQLNNID